MENWGLITYRTTAVLFDEKTSDSRYKNRVAYVVAHGKIAFPSSINCANKFWQSSRINGLGTLSLWTGGQNCGSTKGLQLGLGGTPLTTSILVSIQCNT